VANPQTENGHLDLANEIVEVMAKTQLSGYESRILWVVWRRTYCWHKKEEVIKFKHFREATGIVDSHLSRTIKKLVERKILTKNGNKYSFQKDYQKWQLELPKMVSRVTKNGNNTYQKRSSVASTKETIKRNLLKETIKRKGTKVPREYGNKDINKLFKCFTSKGISLTKQKLNRYAGQRLIKKYGLEKCVSAIEYALSIQGEQYAPQILNLLDLEEKMSKLIIYKKRGENGRNTIEVEGKRISNSF